MEINGNITLSYREFKNLELRANETEQQINLKIKPLEQEIYKLEGERDKLRYIHEEEIKRNREDQKRLEIENRNLISALRLEIKETKE